MLGRQSVRVTYAHKRRHAQKASKNLLSSPLEVLPPEIDDLTRTQMARRMLKRSRRVALADQLEDKNAECMREHLAKRIKRTKERVSNVEPAVLPSDVPPPDDVTFQTPFSSSKSVCESTVVKPSMPEQLSPVPVAKRVMSRTSSINLKENFASSQTLASPFSSRPGSAASSPKHKKTGRPSRRVSRGSFHVKSRTISGVFKENARRVLRKGSAVSLKDEPTARHIKHRRYPSSPSTSYMRSRFGQEDWIAPPKTFSRAFYDYEEIPSSGGSAHSNASFYADQPQSCSTPAVHRLRKLPNLHRRQVGTDNILAPSHSRKDSTELGGLDVEMVDGIVLSPRRQTIHLSGNSIFSSSDEFTIGSLPAANSVGTIVERTNTTHRDKAPAREAAQKSQGGQALAGSFVAEYNVPLFDLPYSPASTAAVNTFGQEGVLKSSVGEQSFGLLGTSPVHDRSLLIRTPRDSGTLTSLSSPPEMAASCPPSSPASDLALEFRSMDICDNVDTQPGGETILLRARSRSLQDAVAINKPVKQRPARDRAGTIRASDFAKPGVCSSGVAPGFAVSSLSNVRRTRSGTVVGPDSRLATKGAGLPTRAARGAHATGLVPVQFGSEFESDDELLLKHAWFEDLEYLGLGVPQMRKDPEADEMNLGGSWHGLQSGPPRRLGLRRR